MRHPGNTGCQAKDTSLLPGLRLQGKVTGKVNPEAKCTGHQTHRMSPERVRPLGWAGGNPPSSCSPVRTGSWGCSWADKLPPGQQGRWNRNRWANGPVPEITILQRKGAQGHKSKIWSRRKNKFTGENRAGQGKGDDPRQRAGQDKGPAGLG